MRYTTLIDLRDYPGLYRNHNVRLVYMHLVLVAGYHDANRDIVSASLRTMAADIGVSMSALRHALAVLAKAKLIQRRQGRLYVAKWLPEQRVSKRRCTQLDPKTQAAVNEIHQAMTNPPKEKGPSGYEQIVQMAKAGDPKWIDFCKKHKWQYQ